VKSTRDTAFDEVALHLSPRAGRFVSARTLAKIWEIPAREVRVLGDVGIAVQVEPDRFDIAQSTANYIAHLREQCAGRRGATDATSEIIVSANARLRKTRTELLNLRTKAGHHQPVV
jgi:hypothetical protein